MKILIDTNILGKKYKIMVSYSESEFDYEYIFHGAEIVSGSFEKNADFLLDNENFLAEAIDSIEAEIY